MTKKKTKESPFKTGRAKFAGSRSDGLNFIGIKPDESITFAPMVGLDQMVYADMHEYWDIRPAIFHPCIGYDCPGCKVGNETRFKAYLPVIMKDGTQGIYAFTKSVYDQLENLEDSLEESMKGFVIKVSRRGAGLKTRYTVLGTGKKIDVEGMFEDFPDFLGRLGPQTEEDIWQLLEANGYSRDGSFRADSDGGESSDKWEDI